MHMSSIWRDPHIQEFPLSKLSVMEIHSDNRWQWRDLPRMTDGLWYPVMIYKVTPEWWHTKYLKWCTKTNVVPEPTVNEDGMIWAVKMGGNRILCAHHLKYTSIDGIMCDHPDECAKIGRWYAEADPLHNPDAKYTGAWNYK